MTTRILMLTIALCLLSTPTLSWAGDAEGAAADAKRADARKLMELMGSAEIGSQVMGSMLEMMRPAFPTVPAEFWDEVAKEMTGEELVELIIPVYLKNFTHDEILQLIEFYETPLGRKLIAAQPAIVQESMVIGGQWGEKKGAEIVEKMKAAGY